MNTAYGKPPPLVKERMIFMKHEIDYIDICYWPDLYLRGCFANNLVKK